MATIESLCRLAWVVAQYIENEEAFAVIRPAIISILSSRASANVDDITQRILEHVLGYGSKSAAVLRMINQAVILEGMYMLRCATDRSGVLAHCRDLREDRGWQVHVEIGSVSVVITHVRTELCGDVSIGTQGAFEVCWHLRTVFPSSMSALQSASLRIASVSFDPSCDDVVRRRVGRALGNGEMIIT
jgi:hypothetical protein